jgi:hypothetical protein
MQFTLNGRSAATATEAAESGEQEINNEANSIPSRFSPWRSPRTPEIIQGEPYISSPTDQITLPPFHHDRNDIHDNTNTNAITNTNININDNSTIVAHIPHAPTAWGANFWVVLADPVTEHSFYACPATGDCSWDPPVHAMVLPRNAAGE